MSAANQLSRNAQAMLLLTSHLSKAGSEDAKPLGNMEWGRFASWLKEMAMTPEDLLLTETMSLLKGWHDSKVSVDRIGRLLNRGHSLALAVEKWQRAGLWVVTRSDPGYPIRLKRRLKESSPPVLFGCGNKALLGAGGLAVVGSRNASDADLSCASLVGTKAAAGGFATISGGALGVDETAMLGAMNNGGTVIGVVANNLLRTATSKKWRQGLMDGMVALISPFYPEAGFSAGNAMARNKYIYCLADSALVIHSGKKGGTLNGAEENLKKAWVPLWVKPTNDSDAANAKLVAKGGRWCEADIESLSIADLLTDTTPQTQTEQIAVSPLTPDLFNKANPHAAETRTLATGPRENKAGAKHEAIAAENSKSSVDFYQLFIAALDHLAESPVTRDELIDSTGLHKSQLDAWLKRAVSDDAVKKLKRPVRYQTKKSS